MQSISVRWNNCGLWLRLLIKRYHGFAWRHNSDRWCDFLKRFRAVEGFIRSLQVISLLGCSTSFMVWAQVAVATDSFCVHKTITVLTLRCHLGSAFSMIAIFAHSVGIIGKSGMCALGDYIAMDFVLNALAPVRDGIFGLGSWLLFFACHFLFRFALSNGWWDFLWSPRLLDYLGWRDTSLVGVLLNLIRILF